MSVDWIKLIALVMVDIIALVSLLFVGAEVGLLIEQLVLALQIFVWHTSYPSIFIWIPGVVWFALIVFSALFVVNVDTLLEAIFVEDDEPELLEGFKGYS